MPTAIIRVMTTTTRLRLAGIVIATIFALGIFLGGEHAQIAQIAGAAQVAPVAPVAPAPAPKASLILLYDDIPSRHELEKCKSIGAMKWMNVSQDIESYKTGVLNVFEIIRTIDRRTEGRLPAWLMLDAEVPFMDDLNKDPATPEFKRATSTIISTIRALKLNYPGTKWTMYGMPNLAYWIGSDGWGKATESDRRATLTRVAKTYAPIIAELDWVSVSIYDYYDPRMVEYGNPNSVRGTPESVRRDGHEWRIAQVGLAKLLGGSKLVIPTVFPFWAPGGVAPYCRVINPRDFIQDQIAPAIGAGANGFALWATTGYRIEQITRVEQDPSLESKEKNFGVTEWRAAVTADYLGGTQPADWNTPAIRDVLTRVRHHHKAFNPDLASQSRLAESNSMAIDSCGFLP